VTLLKNKSGGYEADIRDRAMGRLHLSLDTKRSTEAMARHTAVEKLMREGHKDLVEQLRKRQLNVAAVERCVRDKKDFDTLRARDPWPSVDDAIDLYVEWLEAHPKKTGSTAATAKSQLERFREFVHEHPELGDDARLDQVSSAHFAEYQKDVVIRFRKNTAVSYLARVGAVYRWEQKREERAARETHRTARTLHSPVDLETMPREKTSRSRWLSEAEAERLLAATPASMLFPITCGLLAGLRIQETLHLRPPPFDIDLELGLITVQERDGWRPKNGKTRRVPISDDLRPILELHLARYASAQWIIPGLRDRSLPRVTQGFAEHFNRIVSDAGLVAGYADAEGVVYHTLRHTFASWLVMRGVDLYTVAQLLGNSLHMVETTYAHLAPDFKKAAMSRLNGLISIRLPIVEEEPALV
jgi:integrase